jgi:hypothetical protein
MSESKQLDEMTSEEILALFREDAAATARATHEWALILILYHRTLIEGGLSSDDATSLVFGYQSERMGNRYG